MPTMQSMMGNARTARLPRTEGRAMITLEKQFYSRGFCHKLVRRAGFVATYARFRRSDPEKVHCEVVRIKTRPALTVFGNEVPAHEVYPPSESWGTDGFTYRDEDEARSRFEMLVAKETQRELSALPT